MTNRHLSLIVVITIAMLCLGIVLTVCYSTVSGVPVHADGFQTLKEWGLVLIGGLVGFIAPFKGGDELHAKPIHTAAVAAVWFLTLGAGFSLSMLLAAG